MSLTRIDYSMIENDLTFYGNDFATAIDAIGSTPTTLTISQQPNDIDTDVTIPSNIHLNWQANCVVSGTATLTISGSINAGKYKLFNENTSIYVDGYVYLDWFGAVGDGVTDDTLAINRAVLSNANLVYGYTNSVYTTSSKITIASGQVFDLAGAYFKMAPNADFTTTESIFELDNDWCKLINFKIDGNKSNVSSSPASGSWLAGIVIRGSNIVVKNGYIHDCVTNGCVVYGDGSSNIDISDITINDCNWIAFGNEIPEEGDSVSSNISFINIKTNRNLLGGCYIASGSNITISKCICNDANTHLLYIGDANGGLFNCFVSDSVFNTTNIGVSSLEICGEVLSGSLLGQTNTCEVSLSNVSVDSGGGGNGIYIHDNVEANIVNTKINNASIGLNIGDTCVAYCNNININDVLFYGISTTSKIFVDNITIKNYGSYTGSYGAIVLGSGSSNSNIRNISIGAQSGETGSYGFVIASGLLDITIDNVYSFNGISTLFNASFTDLANCNIYNTGATSDRFQKISGVNGIVTFIGVGYTWMDGTGDFRLLAGSVPPTTDTDGVVVGQQS